jgi:hypothetical protein
LRENENLQGLWWPLETMPRENKMWILWSDSIKVFKENVQNVRRLWFTRNNLNKKKQANKQSKTRQNKQDKTNKTKQTNIWDDIQYMNVWNHYGRIDGDDYIISAKSFPNCLYKMHMGSWKSLIGDLHKCTCILKTCKLFIYYTMHKVMLDVSHDMITYLTVLDLRVNKVISILSSLWFFLRYRPSFIHYLVNLNILI